MSEFESYAEGLPPTIPPPLWVENISCYTPELLHNINFLKENYLSVLDVVKALTIFITGMTTLIFNIIFTVVLNCAYYRNFLRPQPRYILTAMSLNDILNVTLVLLIGVYPALWECWPLGQFWCQIQAFLRGALTQNASFILILLASERYVASVHPFSYSRVCDKKVVLFVILLCFGASGSFYAFIVLHSMGFHFNINGLMICEPSYLSNNLLILASCIFYFPTTMVLMYCYGTIFHSSKAKSQYRSVIFKTLPLLAGQTAQAGIDMFKKERRRNELVSRTSAAISLTFIVAVTPWAIKQIITSVTRTTAPALTDFLVTWLESSHGIWSPAIFWMLNPKFRSSVSRFYIRKILCRPIPSDWRYAEEDSDEWYPGKGLRGGGGTSLSEPTRETIVREEVWGHRLDRSFSRANLDQNEPVFCTELQDFQQPHYQQQQHHLQHSQSMSVTPTSICDRHKHQYSVVC